MNEEREGINMVLKFGIQWVKDTWWKSSLENTSFATVVKTHKEIIIP